MNSDKNKQALSTLSLLQVQWNSWNSLDWHELFHVLFHVIGMSRSLNTPLMVPVFSVGKPIDVEKVPEPTSEQVDELHERYMAALTELFEVHKLKYGAEESSQLIIN